MLMYSLSYLRSHPQFKWGPNLHLAARTNESAENLQYGSGPVQTDPEIFLVFWGWKNAGDTHADPDGVAADLNQFFSIIGGGGWVNIDTQYYQVGSGGSIDCITNPASQLAGVWYDGSSVPPTVYADADIQGEAAKAETHFGYSANANYFVVTPTGHSTNGFGTAFCAYHSAFNDTAGNPVAYTDLPYLPDAGFSCGEDIVNSPGVLDGVSIVGGHEEAEVQTDPQPISGWSGPNNEIGDACAWQNLVDNPAAGGFPTQPLWDNFIGACAQIGP
jgi:serine protease